jgi:hypothetical protein
MFLKKSKQNILEMTWLIIESFENSLNYSIL